MIDTKIVFQNSGTQRRSPFLLFDPPLQAYDASVDPSERLPLGFNIMHRPYAATGNDLLLKGVRFLVADNITKAISRWLRSVSLQNSFLQLTNDTVLVQDPPPSLYLTATERMAGFVAGGWVLVVQETDTDRPELLVASGPTASPDPLDRVFARGDMTLVFVGKPDRMFTQTTPKIGTVSFPNRRMLTEVPEWLAEVKDYYVEDPLEPPGDGGDEGPAPHDGDDGGDDDQGAAPPDDPDDSDYDSEGVYETFTLAYQRMMEEDSDD